MKKALYLPIAVLMTACGSEEPRTPAATAPAKPAITAPAQKVVVQKNYSDASGQVDPQKVDTASRNFNALGSVTNK
jgi:hypothetical protein